MAITKNIAKELEINENSVENTIQLLKDDATIPFIARYRKEKTGNLDETQIKNIKERFEYYTELEKRKQTVLQTVKDQGKLTPALEKEILSCTEKQKLEDIYLPYKPKKRTRATIAKEKGLEPLADLILAQQPYKGTPPSKDELSGAKDIIAEKISDRADIRGYLRKMTYNEGKIVSKVKKEFKGKKTKYETYYDFSEPVKKSPSHRILAMQRGEKEKVLSWKKLLDDYKDIFGSYKNLIES